MSLPATGIWKSRYASWLIPLTVFVAYLGYAAWADRAFLFDRFLLPTADYAADDLLIFQAKRLHLLHGNYSRFGFHHPGPWFLFMAGVAERVLYDWTGCFASYTAAQAFGTFAGFAVAFALSCRLWLLASGKISLALAAIVLIIATLLAPVAPTNLFTQAFWTPYATVAASLLLATGLLGMVLRGSSWLPLALLGGAQMMHGHASFLGIVPMILLVALAMAAVYGRVPFRILDRRSVTGWMTSNRIAMITSLVIAMLYAAPLVINLALHWPGDFGAYLQYAGAITANPIRKAAHFAGGFIPLYGVWLLLFLLPGKSTRQDQGARHRPARRPTFDRAVCSCSARVPCPHSGIPGIASTISHLPTCCSGFLLLLPPPWSALRSIRSRPRRSSRSCGSCFA